MFVIFTALFKGRVVESIHKVGSTRFTHIYLHWNFESILFLHSSFPSLCGFVEFLSWGFIWGLLGAEINSLDCCIHHLGAVLGRDPSWSQFELVWENPNSIRIFRSAIDLKIRLSSKFMDTLENICQDLCKISPQSEFVWFSFAFKNWISSCWNQH